MLVKVKLHAKVKIFKIQRKLLSKIFKRIPFQGVTRKGFLKLSKGMMGSQNAQLSYDHVIHIHHVTEIELIETR